MNSVREHSTAMVAPDAERRALELRIRAAKARLFEDLDRASALVRHTAHDVGANALRVALVGGLLFLGAAITLLVRRRKHRIRVTWR